MPLILNYWYDVIELSMKVFIEEVKSDYMWYINFVFEHIFYIERMTRNLTPLFVFEQ